MITKAQKVRFGVFISVCMVLIIAIFVVLAGKKLTQKSDTYYVAYTNTSVNGLQIGGQVKYHGIQVGSVEDISIDENNVERIIVKLRIRAKTPIKADVTAQLVMVGITGLKQIELIGGSNNTKSLSSGDYITAGKSALDSISGKAEDIVEKVDRILDNIVVLINKENQARFNNILANTDSLTFHFYNLASETTKTMEGINSVINSPHLKNIVKNSDKISGQLASADLGLILNDLKKTLTSTKRLIGNVDITVLKGRQDFLQALEQVRESAENLNEFTRLIIENPSYLIRGKSNE